MEERAKWSKITSNNKDEKTKQIDVEEGDEKPGGRCTQILERKWLLNYFAWKNMVLHRWWALKE